MVYGMIEFLLFSCYKYCLPYYTRRCGVIGIYIILIMFLLGMSMLLKSLIKDKRKQESCILIFGIVLMYAICALKKDIVGIDILGYKSVYESSCVYPWSNFNFVYFEWGYILIMKIFAKIGLSFQLFLAIVYAFIFYSLYCFVKRYSKDITLSLLIYICYVFFVFNMTGIRNSISIAICLFSFRLLEKSSRKSVIEYILLVTIACFFHKSAFIFYFVYFIVKVKVTPIIAIGYIGVSLGAVIFRNNIYGFINIYLKQIGQAGEVSIGGNIIFLILIEVFSLVSVYYNALSHHKDLRRVDSMEYRADKSIFKSISQFDINKVSLKLIYFAILVLIITGKDTASRNAMFLMIFIIILLPNVLQLYKEKERILLKGIFISFIIIFFYIYVLSTRQYNIVPYYFFWQ